MKIVFLADFLEMARDKPNPFLRIGRQIRRRHRHKTARLFFLPFREKMSFKTVLKNQV